MLFKELSSADKDLISKYIHNYAFNEEVAKPSAATINENLEYILRYWNSEKQQLYKMLGNRFILEIPIEHSPSLGDIARKMIDFWHTSMDSDPFIREWLKTFESYRKTNPDIYSDEEDPNYSFYWNMIALVSDGNCLAQNTWRYASFDVPLPNGKTYTVKYGAKVIKTVGRIVKEYNLNSYFFDKWRIKHSMILNEKARKQKTLCLSIHPLDYMTMSDNDSGWQSCMSWRDEGAYRQGTVEMMNSSYVVIAYFKSQKEDMVVPGGHWNNKRWRELFIVSPQLICSVRGYPYSSDELEREILRILRILCKKNLGWEYEDQLFVYDEFNTFEASDAPSTSCYHALGPDWVNMTPEHEKLFSDLSFGIDFATNKMYNDMDEGVHAYLNFQEVRKGCHYHSDYNKNLRNYHSGLIINYSGQSECVCCGNSIDIIPDNVEAKIDEVHLICPTCGGLQWCSCCETYNTPDRMIALDGEQICIDCYEENSWACECCSESFLNEHDKQCNIYLTLAIPREDDDVYLISTVSRVLVCESCLVYIKDKYLLPGADYISYPHPSTDERDYYITPDILNDDGWIYFYNNSAETASFLSWKISVLEKFAAMKELIEKGKSPYEFLYNYNRKTSY